MKHHSRTSKFRTPSLFTHILCLTLSLSFVIVPVVPVISPAQANSPNPIESAIPSEQPLSTPENLDVFKLLKQHKSELFKGPFDLDVRSITWDRPNDGESFRILFQGKPVLSFDIPNLAIERIGNYLVILEKDAYVESQQHQNISFIDLDAYRLNIGKTEIPVFRIPVKSDSPAISMRDFASRITPKAFSAYSEVQQLAVNITANLLNPKTYSDIGPVVDEFAQAFEHAVEVQGKAMESQATTSKSYGDEYKKMSEAIFDSKLREHTPPSLTNSVLSIQETMCSQRKLSTRMQLLWARMSLPAPEAPAQIKMGLTMVASGMFSEGLSHLVYHPSFKKGLIALPFVGLGITGAILRTLLFRLRKPFFISS
jgi:hypothetical protein